MRKIHTVLLALLLIPLALSYPTRVLGKVPRVEKERAVVLQGIIKTEIVAPTMDKMQVLVDKGAASIDLIIASPGGNVIASYLFLNYLKHVKGKGVTLRCFVPTVAASMAFSVLMRCDERYTLDTAFLLWHRVRIHVNGYVTGPDAERLAFRLGAIDDILVRELVRLLGKDLSREEIMYHLDEETRHIGRALAEQAPSFLKSYPYIPGLIDVLQGK